MKIEARNAVTLVNHLKNLDSMLIESPGPYPFTVYEELVKLENRANQICTKQCNGEGDENKLERSLEKIEKRVKSIFKPEFAEAIFINGDPRGYSLKMKEYKAKETGLYQDWGGYGILAPKL